MSKLLSFLKKISKPKRKIAVGFQQ